MRRALASVLFALLLAGTGIAAAAPARRPIAETDLLKFRWIADPRISPDGRQVAYVLVTINEKDDAYETSIWLVPASGAGAPRALTSGRHDTAPRWSPDSGTLAFLRAEEKAPPQIYLLPMGGGEGRKLTDLPKGASPAVWSPDGTTIAFTSGTTPEDLEEQKQNAGKPSAEPPKKSDVVIVTQAHYRENDGGITDPKEHSHLWTVPASGSSDGPPSPAQITTGRYDEQSPVWSLDGSRIYVISDRVDEPYYKPSDSNVYAVPAKGGALETVVDIDGDINEVALSPADGAIALTGSLNLVPERSYKQTDLLLMRGGKTDNLTADFDYDLGNLVVTDQHPPRGGSGPSPMIWTPDGAAIILTATEHGRSNLMRFNVASRRAEALTAGDHEIAAYTATPDAARFALTMGDGTHLLELYLLDAASRHMTRLTHENDALLEGLDLSVPERITYASFDGQSIEAWVVKPPGFNPKKKYPLILNIHGGPHVAYADTFFHEFQWMAAKGYVVLAPNPRGSTSYGADFGNVIQYRYPGDDYKDLMAGVDELIRRGYVDESKLGVTGGSGGGLLTNWTVTQTTRFKAAVSQRSIGDWASFWYSTDFTLFTPFWFRQYPFQDPEEFRKRSPVTYVEKITTPLMLIEGETDLRTPTDAGGGTMFRALKALHRTTVMVLFPNETHELSRSGKPSHRIERLRHILNWFDKYLQGKPIADYDLS